MEIYSRLYVGETVKAPDKIIRKLKRHSRLLNAWVITLAPNIDQLELYHTSVLMQRYYRYRNFHVIGIAGNREEAVNLVVTITQECFDRHGNANLKEYLKETE